MHTLSHHKYAVAILLGVSLPVLILAVILALLSGGLPAGSAVAQPEQLAFAPGRVIVQFHTGARLLEANGVLSTGQPSLDNLLIKQGVRAAEPLFAAEPQLASRADTLDLSSIYILHLQLAADVLQTVAVLSADANVEWAEPDYLARASLTPSPSPEWRGEFPSPFGGGVRGEGVMAVTPNDPFFSEQWGLSKISAPTAWDVVTGTNTVAIAVVDSGLDLIHPDLSGKLWVNPGEIAGNSIDDDNNGYVDDVNGWDFVNDDNDPSDDEGHGTQVAGVAAATTDNAAGIAGMCWGCRIMVVKVMQASGVANYSDIAAGVKYAADKGADVINLSLGGYSNSNALREAIQYAVSKDVVVVAGAGNDNVSTPFYPAAYEDVLAVAGTTISDTKASMSNYGTWVDVSAPAVAITTTFMGGGYGAANGTSFAAPLAAGLAGLIRSQHEDWTPAMVRAQIMHTAKGIDGLNPGYGGKLGSGRLNAAEAVTVVPHPLLAIQSMAVNGDPLGRPTPGVGATLSIALSNDWLDATGVTGMLTTADAYVTVITGTASFGGIPSGGSATNSPLYQFITLPTTPSPSRSISPQTAARTRQPWPSPSPPAAPMSW